MRSLRQLVVAGSVLLAGADGFRGCEPDPALPPGGAPLPVEPAACRTDADCPALGCAVVECLLGECVEIAPMRDDDRDGHAPPPCGGDCDDGRAATYPGAEELCNAIDDDCDGAVDDGAPRTDAVFPVSAAGPLSVVVPWEDELLVTVVTRSAIWGVPVTVGGALGVPLEITRLTMGSRFAVMAAAAHSDGRIMLVSATDLGYASYLVFRRTPSGGVERLAGPSRIDAPPVEALEVIPFGDGFALAYETSGPAGYERAVAFDPDAPPTVSMTLDGLYPLGFATDGARVALNDDAGAVRFFEPDGTEAGSTDVPNVLRVARPLASSDGYVVAGFADVFEYVLAPLDAASGLGSAVRAPPGPSERFEVFATSSVVYVVRSGREGTLVTPLAPDLETRAGNTLGIAPPGSTGVRVSVAESRTASGVLGATDMGGQLAILGACGGD